MADAFREVEEGDDLYHACLAKAQAVTRGSSHLVVGVELLLGGGGWKRGVGAFKVLEDPGSPAG